MLYRLRSKWMRDVRKNVAVQEIPNTNIQLKSLGCKQLSGLDSKQSPTCPHSAYTDVPDACKPFASTSKTFEEKSSCPSHDIPPTQATTISSDGQHYVPMRKAPAIEQPDPSSLVTSSLGISPFFTLNLSSNFSHSPAWQRNIAEIF